MPDTHPSATTPPLPPHRKVSLVTVLIIVVAILIAGTLIAYFYFSGDEYLANLNSSNSAPRNTGNVNFYSNSGQNSNSVNTNNAILGNVNTFVNAPLNSNTAINNLNTLVNTED
ncbi:MAG: hypothetical protein V1685_02230 [Parcubacteria group bacterium]